MGRGNNDFDERVTNSSIVVQIFVNKARDYIERLVEIPSRH